MRIGKFILIALIVFIGVLIFKSYKPFVIDKAQIMTPQQENRLSNYHKQLLVDHDIDYRVLITKNVGDINVFANKKFREMQVGKHSKSGRGLLLVIDPAQDLVRLEVSAALEGVYTDTFVGYMERQQMVYFFRTNRVADGILAATEMLFTWAQKAEAGQGFSPPTGNFSAGAGAKTEAKLGKGFDRAYNNIREATPQAQGLSPKDIVNAYHDAMSQRNGSPNLSIYSKDSVKMMQNWTITPAQMDNVVRTFENCSIKDVKIANNFAVVRYNVEERQCSPYFLVKEGGEWKLDLTMMQKGIMFNHRNQWHLNIDNHSALKNYEFAFSDWRFDRNGFPFNPKD